MIAAAQWRDVLVWCGVRVLTAATWAPLFERLIQASSFSQGSRELDDFVGQVLHETTNLDHLEESLQYSAKRMTEVWKERFPTLESAMPYAFSPEKLANKVYGGRLGNTEPGDGYRYRGRGIPMITGKANYQLLQDLIGQPLVAQPDLLLQPEHALRCAVLWWEKKVPDSAIDSCDRVTRAVNGGQVGLADRMLLTARANAALLRIGVAT